MRHSAHEVTRLLVADAQLGRLQTRPACLTLRQWQALGLADDLADARVAEKMRMHRRRLAGRTMF